MIDKKIWQRLADGNLTDNDRQQLDELLNTAEGRERLTRQMDEVLATLENTSENQAQREVIDEMYRYVNRRIRRARYRSYMLRVAAVLLPVVTFIGGWWLAGDQLPDSDITDDWNEVVTACGERTQIVFQDGTHVWLNADSRLCYPVRFAADRRNVKLEGEAYFSVTTNSERPFVINANDISVLVTGTEFNVSAYAADSLAVVTLDEGQVTMQTPDHTIAMQAGEELSYNRYNRQIRCTNGSLRRSLWRQGVLAFDKAPFTEVATELHRWYGVDFDLNEIDAGAYLFTMTSSQEPLDSILADLSLMSPLRFNRRGNNIKVSARK